MNLKSPSNHPQLYLSLQRALWGQVKPNLRLFSCKMKDARIVLLAVIDGEVTESDKELMGEVETEVISDLDSDEIVQMEVLRCDYPGSLSEYFGDRIIYLRYEDFKK